MLLNNRGSAAPFSLARLAWGLLEACSQPSPTRTSETRGENGAHCLPAVSQALCCGQDNLANELVKRPLVTRLASPRPIWEIPLRKAAEVLRPRRLSLQEAGTRRRCAPALK